MSEKAFREAFIQADTWCDSAPLGMSEGICVRPSDNQATVTVEICSQADDSLSYINLTPDQVDALIRALGLVRVELSKAKSS